MVLLTNINELMPEENLLLKEAVNKFNPCLKYLLAKEDPILFKRYNYNTCRQTAFWGADFLTRICEKNGINYSFRAFEATCKDVLHGQPVNYVHAYIYAESDTPDKNLLIDLSRTEQPMMFYRVKKNEYPVIYGYYENLEVKSIKEINWKETLNETEFLTRRSGKEVSQDLYDMCESFDKMDDQEKEFFTNMVYNVFTESFSKAIGAVPQVSLLEVKEVYLLE